jgi:hypothetical protein
VVRAMALNLGMVISFTPSKKLFRDQMGFGELPTLLGATAKVVTSDVFRENHVRRTSSGHLRIQTNVRVSRPPADSMSKPGML